MPQAMRGMRGRMQAMHGRMMGERGGRMEGMRDKKGRMQGMMGERRAEPSDRDTTARQFQMGHRDMSAMHETMARMHSERRARMAARHRKMAQWHEQMMGGSADEPAETPGESAKVPGEAVPSGASLFAQHCASCHGQNGRGIAGTFPPLTGTDWVTGEVSVPTRIVLHGLEGPVEVNGDRYDGVMPAFGGRLSDAEVAGLLTFLRTSINGKEDSVTADEVATIRDAYSGRQQPWTSQELQGDRTRPSKAEDEN